MWSASVYMPHPPRERSCTLYPTSCTQSGFRAPPTEGSLLPPYTAAAYRSRGRIQVLLWGCGSFGLLVLAVSSSPLPGTDTWILSVLASDGCLGDLVPIDQRDEVTGSGQHRELVTEAGLEAKSPDSLCDAL